MCRMILAMGRFESRSIVAAAVAMAEGLTSDHEATFNRHPHGWGASWRDAASPKRIGVFRDQRPATQAALDSPVAQIETGLLAVHVRRAIAVDTVGLGFTHPLERAADDWVFMHNGSQPTIHRLLGLERSRFDSAEYFDYLIPKGARRLDPQVALSRLADIPEPAGNCANAIALSTDRVYVVHWRSPSDGWPLYFTMHRLKTPDCEIISSEIIPDLGPPEDWQPLAPQSVEEFAL